MAHHLTQSKSAPVQENPEFLRLNHERADLEGPGWMPRPNGHLGDHTWNFSNLTLLRLCCLDAPPLRVCLIDQN